MPKATLEFKLPEESSEFYDATNGTKYSIILRELDEMYRNLLKYDEGVTAPERVIYEQFRNTIHKLCMEYEVKLYE